MAREPEDRYTSAKELAAELRRWLDDEPVNAWREPPSLRARRWHKRHRTFVTAVATTLPAALVLWVLWQYVDYVSLQSRPDPVVSPLSPAMNLPPVEREANEARVSLEELESQLPGEGRGDNALSGSAPDGLAQPPFTLHR
jgi:hypothetical protein